MADRLLRPRWPIRGAYELHLVKQTCFRNQCRHLFTNMQMGVKDEIQVEKLSGEDEPL